MKLTYLGHAGFCLETDLSILVMDPWLGGQGAFDASWFPFPKNEACAEFVRDRLTIQNKEKFIYISHEHQDHFDATFLASIKQFDFTFILARFDFPIVKNKLIDMGYSQEKMVILEDQEQFHLPDALVTLFMIDDELNCDSSILVKTKHASFLNINDCKIHDRLHHISHTYGPITVFTCQFSGASWYPTCYQMSKAIYQQACEKKIADKFFAVLEAIKTVKPLLYLPSAGPPCFLDPNLLHLNFELNTYPRAHQLIDYLDHKGESVSKWTKILPGDILDLNTLNFIYKSSEVIDFKPYVLEYAKSYQKLFQERHKANCCVNAEQVFSALKPNLLRKLAALKEINHQVKTFAEPTFRGVSAESMDPVDEPRGVVSERNCRQPLLYWRIAEYPDLMYCLDLANQTIKEVSDIADQNHYVRITAPAWQVNKVLEKQISWPDFALTFRLSIERVPETYDTILHGFLILDAEKIASFCEKHAAHLRKKERIIISVGDKKYSILRYCPHQGADLAEGHVEGASWVCPRHQWSFDLARRGQCNLNQSCIGAIEMDSTIDKKNE